MLNLIKATVAYVRGPGEKITHAHYQWHKHRSLFSLVQLMDGSLSNAHGQLWRRRTFTGEWEYKQDPETKDQFLDRQW